jgi:putative membrane protein
MTTRIRTRVLVALAIAGLVGCESTEFNYPGKNVNQSASVGQSYSPDFDNAQLATARFDGQATALDNKLFTMQANSDSGLAIEMAKLAEQKSNTASIRRFASRISQEHQRSIDQIKSLAQARNYALAEALMPEQQSAYDDLAGLSGGDFDRQFLEAEIRNLESAVQLYQGGSNQLPDNDLRAFAVQTLPTLRDQVQTARDLLRNMGSAVR